MEAEQLRDVIEAFQSLAGDARAAFLWYLIACYLAKYATVLVGLLIGGAFVSRAVRYVFALTHADERLRRAAGVRFGCWSARELDIACNVLAEHFPGNK